MDLLTLATSAPATSGLMLLGLVLLMSLTGGFFRGIVLALLLRRMLRFALPLSLAAGGGFWLAHLFG
ncbi:hypothetical protein FGG78_40690 [Thioclava sp. BHET1]|nr:hypothetical protein FGG78_40690 [Thioclava sp. BHET1]